jgi:acyl-CoA synthetase (AMP-forming)/AMP-acid ligase II
MLGYLNQPEETANRFQGAWFLTGDLGQRTADGAIAFLGRADDMMNAGGFRVSPVEVEDVLSHFAGLGDVACAEVRVSQTTTLIAAFYTASAKIDEDALAAFAKRQLAAYKLPRLYVRVASLPRGANNKLLRQTLRAEWEATHGQA